LSVSCAFFVRRFNHAGAADHLHGRPRWPLCPSASTPAVHDLPTGEEPKEPVYGVQETGSIFIAEQQSTIETPPSHVCAARRWFVCSRQEERLRPRPAGSEIQRLHGVRTSSREGLLPRSACSNEDIE
jgi:hypothetical protein